MKHTFTKISSLLIFSLLSFNLMAQYGPQFENKGFENWTTRELESVSEPVHWHSSGTATGSYASWLPSDPQVESSTQVRPGSTGTKSLRVIPRSVLGVTANGSVTNGRINAGSMTASGANNYNYTQRSETAFNTPISQLPDSLTVWVCFRSQSTSHKAQVKAVVHGDADYMIRANGTEEPTNMHVATAEQRFTRHAPNGGAYNWTRLSIPFVNNGPCTDVRYILLMATTNETPGTGSTNDDLFLDDVLLIYNPTLSMGQLPSTSINPGAVITIPFTLTGTMSPENLNASANQVIAELSDANGSFNNPTILGSTTTNTSGNITAFIPNVANGQYQIRVRSTNYPMIGQNIQTVSIGVSTYTITVAANPSEGGTVTGGGTYDQNTNCTVSATANAGYTFTNWTENGNVVSTDASYTFTVQGDRSLVANFQIQTYNITASADPTAGGNVTGGGTYNQGQSCTLTATTNSGYTFVNWTKNGTQVSTNPSYTFTVTESAAYVAHFQIQTYNITASADPAAGGNVTGGGTFNHGQSCTLTATTNPGYTFVNWTKNGTQVSTNPSYIFTVTESAAYVAHFQIQSYNISVSADPVVGGNVTGGGTFDYGQSCTVHATANEGYTFINWTENGAQVSANADYTFTVNGNRTLVAHFSTQGYVITALVDPEEGGTVSGSGGYDYGELCTLTATANTGYTFINWTKDNTEVSTNPTYSFTVSESATYVAHFSINSYEITVKAEPNEGGILSGDGEYEYGASCTLTAMANENYEFINWTKDDIEVSTDTCYTFTVTESATYVAHFRYYDNVDEGTTAIQIYPNPFASTLSIRVEKAVKSVCVFDLYGRLVKEQSVNGMDIDLDLSELSAGTYLLQLDYGDSRCIRQIVKRIQ